MSDNAGGYSPFPGSGQPGPHNQMPQGATQPGTYNQMPPGGVQPGVPNQMPPGSTQPLPPSAPAQPQPSSWGGAVPGYVAPPQQNPQQYAPYGQVPPNMGPGGPQGGPPPAPKSGMPAIAWVGIVGVLVLIIGAGVYAFTQGGDSKPIENGETTVVESETSTVEDDGPTPTRKYGTRENPVPLGEAADIGDGWRMVVNSVDLDADSEIAKASDYNDPPPAGERYVIANVSLTYDGDDDSAVALVNFSAVGEGTNVVSEASEFGLSKSPPAPELDTLTEVYKGGTISGNISIAVPEEDLETLVIIGAASFSAEERGFFATK